MLEKKLAAKSLKLWFGPLAVLIFIGGTFALGHVTPGYSQVRQTVSELGEAGTVGQLPFTGLLCTVAACLMIYSIGIASSLSKLGHSVLPAYFVFSMAASCAGVGMFSFPHPLHNVFGLSETIGLQAPLAAAFASRNDPRARSLTRFCVLMYAVVLFAIAINLVPVVRPANIWAHIRPYFGVIQRSLFASWFIWCATYAILLMRVAQSSSNRWPAGLTSE
jgi:hypothetical membrane protein